MGKTIKCEVKQNAYRKTMPNQSRPRYLRRGQIVEVGIPLSEFRGWERTFEPVDPADRPDGGPAKQKASMPVPGSEAKDLGVEPSLDEQHAALVVAAAATLDEDSAEGWTRHGFASVKFVKGYVAQETGEQNPKWVTSALIQQLSE